MAEYVKHTGGSHAGKSKKPYDAMVYKDADSGYTIAVDDDGNVIKKILSSANTDEVVIQAALSGITAGNVYVARGDYISGAVRVLIEENKHLSFEKGSNFSQLGVGAAHDFFWLNKNASLSGVTMDFGTTTGNLSGIMLRGSINYAFSDTTLIEDVTITSDTTAGYGIVFNASASQPGYIYGVYVNRVKTYNLAYPIYLRSHASGIVNANTFRDIYAYSSNACIMTVNDGAFLTNDFNMFYNINYQPRLNPLYNAVTIVGKWNYVDINIYDWDTLGGGKYGIYLPANANENTIRFTCALPNPLSNSGSFNKFISALPVLSYSGTAATITAGNTYVDVAHSLFATPTKVRVTPTTNLGTRSFWVDTKGASTFRININSSDVIDHTFDWEAEV